MLTADSPVNRVLPLTFTAESAMKRVRLALAAVITDTPEEDNNPLPNFLRCYRSWTRSICEMGRKGWPGIDWTYLDMVV